MKKNLYIYFNDIGDVLDLIVCYSEKFEASKNSKSLIFKEIANSGKVIYDQN